jgi:hypothetical protein
VDPSTPDRREGASARPLTWAFAAVVVCSLACTSGIREVHTTTSTGPCVDKDCARDTATFYDTDEESGLSDDADTSPRDTGDSSAPTGSGAAT